MVLLLIRCCSTFLVECVSLFRPVRYLLFEERAPDFALVPFVCSLSTGRKLVRTR